MEILIRKKEKLKVLGTKQTCRFLDINSNSLPGHVADQNLAQIINNPYISTFYASFANKILPYSTIDKRIIDPNSICAVPFVDNNNYVKGVIMLYNKQDQNKSLGFFTMNDVYLVQAIGTIVSQILNMKKKISELAHKEELANILRDEIITINQGSSAVLKRKKLIKRCKEIIKNELFVNDDLVSLISECMDSQGVILHIKSNNGLSAKFVQGIEDAIEKTPTSYFSGFTTRALLNIKDLASEPL